MNKKIVAETHPNHYLLHKYWGRKPHNIVNEYIRKYTKEGNIVFDPFMGSGVTIIESLKLNRKAIGVDLNPISFLITKVTIEKTNLDIFSNDFKKILNSCSNIQILLYQTECNRCGSESIIDNMVWEGNIPKKIRGICKKCGVFLKIPNERDEKKIKFIEDNFGLLLIKNKVKKLPDDEIMKYVRRSGAFRITDLFTKRNIIALGILKSKINKIRNIESKNLLLLTFSSMLSNASSMIPGNIDNGNGRSGWVISKLYIPKIHTERNVFSAFKQRFKTIIKGKKELNLNISDTKVKIFNRSSENIKDIIKDNSVDYIFADPPYGENIPYLGCSMLFNSWLGFKTDYENEIICDKYRKKTIQDYKDRLLKVIKECYRILKPSKYLTLTFNNRDLRIWKTILEVVSESGFRLMNINHHYSAVSSGIQGLNKESAIKGDFFYTFKKEDYVCSQKQFELILDRCEDIKNYLIKKVEEIIKKKKGATISVIYENLIPLLVNNGMLERCADYLSNIDDILKNHFRLVIEKDNNKKTDIYKWGI